MTDHVLALHRMLHPESYPREDQPDHVYWDGFDPEHDSERTWRMQPFQWSAETIEWVASYLKRELAQRNERQAKAIVGRDKKKTVRCSECGAKEFKYEEGHPSERTMRRNEDGCLVFWGDFEWFDGDDDPGVVCANGHHIDASAIDVDFSG